ncbi:hypothetical protein SAY87_014872 [Trapa incisa]|uniref:Uncharacterized protein n=1 Tax=Trapa incisa TaxID=236973 RepID=A0AAN7GKQ5_9MYRT|nr:hypothetical protein SAY87_014872 [Trapa incisa]
MKSRFWPHLNAKSASLHPSLSFPITEKINSGVGSIPKLSRDSTDSGSKGRLEASLRRSSSPLFRFSWAATMDWSVGRFEGRGTISPRGCPRSVR